MFQLHYINEEKKKPSEKEKEEFKEEISENMVFWRSLIETPGCTKDGICNNCGLCEH